MNDQIQIIEKIVNQEKCDLKACKGPSPQLGIMDGAS